MEADDDDDDVTMVEVDNVEVKATKKEERPMTVEEATANLSSKQSDDLRFLVKARVSPDGGFLLWLTVSSQVDIILGTQNLSDTFEWDLNSKVAPEEFAALHCKELGLSGEFA